MYITNTYATVFNSNLTGNEKVAFKNLSFSEKQADGTYVNESWTGRFIGSAKAAVEKLPEKTRINILAGNVHNGYNKDKKANYPYVLVTKFEVLAAKEAPVVTEEDLPF